MDIGKAATKSGKRIGNRFDKWRRRGEADTQFTGFAVVQASGASGGIFNLRQYLSAIGEELHSRRRQADAAISAGKQPRANLLFENLNLLA